jgi:large subunit ribosomal protein L31
MIPDLKRGAGSDHGASRAGGGAVKDRRFAMKQGVHPKYEEITATCGCGNVIKTRSTLCNDLHLDVCSACHPFYTGKQKVMDTGGRIDRFNKRFKTPMRSGRK